MAALEDRTVNFWTLLGDMVLNLEKLDRELQAQIQTLRIMHEILRSVPEFVDARIRYLEKRLGADDKTVV